MCKSIIKLNKDSRDLPPQVFFILYLTDCARLAAFRIRDFRRHSKFPADKTVFNWREQRVSKGQNSNKEEEHQKSLSVTVVTACEQARQPSSGLSEPVRTTL